MSFVLDLRQSIERKSVYGVHVLFIHHHYTVPGCYCRCCLYIEIAMCVNMFGTRYFRSVLWFAKCSEGRKSDDTDVGENIHFIVIITNAYVFKV